MVDYSPKIKYLGIDSRFFR